MQGLLIEPLADAIAGTEFSHFTPIFSYLHQVVSLAPYRPNNVPPVNDYVDQYLVLNGTEYHLVQGERPQTRLPLCPILWINTRRLTAPGTIRAGRDRLR